jgi:NADH-quinone oxidoreductase subunit M
MFEHVLSVIIFLPLIAGLLLLATPASRTIARFTGLIISLSTLVLSLDLYAGFQSTGHFEFVENIPWITSLGISYALGVDGISLFILMATSVLLPMVYFIFSTREKGYYANLLLVQGAMTGAICATDMILFYIFWEIMLLPVFFMLGLYGGPKRLPATLKITLYTIAGSLLMLAAIVYLGVSYHSQFNEWSFAMDKMAQLNLCGQVAAVAFFRFMIAFAIKIPCFHFTLGC